MLTGSEMWARTTSLPGPDLPVNVNLRRWDFCTFGFSQHQITANSKATSEPLCKWAHFHLCTDSRTSLSLVAYAVLCFPLGRTQSCPSIIGLFVCSLIAAVERLLWPPPSLFSNRPLGLKGVAPSLSGLRRNTVERKSSELHAISCPASPARCLPKLSQKQNAGEVLGELVPFSLVYFSFL